MKSITTRQKKILRILSAQEEFITTSQIADQLDVSSKTIERELNIISKWLTQEGITLEKKPRYGLKILVTSKQRQQLLETINEEDVITIFSQEDRGILNLIELLKEKDPIKLYALARNTSVTESTISNDLDKLEQYLEAYNMRLVRKPGVGVYLQGTEEDIRRVSIDLMYENIDIKKLMTLKKNDDVGGFSLKNTQVKKKVLGLVDITYIEEIDELVKDIGKEMKISFVETSYTHIIVHLLLIMERIKVKQKMEVSDDLVEALKKGKEWSVALAIQKKIEERLNVTLPKEEMAYLAIHLRGIKRYNTEGFNEGITRENIKIIKLAKDMIKLTESETGMFLDEEGELFTALVYHLIAGISRISMNLPIRNPMVAEIKESYPEVFRIASECAKLIEERFLLVVPQTEIGYIAMHLGAAIVSITGSSERKYKVVVSCVLGMGSSGLLKSRIEKEFPAIKVEAVLPVNKVESDYLKGSPVDFVISTVELNCPYKPSICVGPILSEKDKVRIKEFIKTLPQKNMSLSQSKGMTESPGSKIHDLKEAIQGIENILENFQIHSYEDQVTVKMIIRNVSEKLGQEEGQKVSIETALLEREKHGSTILSKENAMLLHCKAEGAEELHFEIIRLKKPIPVESSKSQKIDLVILMVVPQKCSENYLEIMRYISQMLIEKKDFIRNLREQEFNPLKSYMNKMLLYYYQGKI